MSHRYQDSYSGSNNMPYQSVDHAGSSSFLNKYPPHNDNGAAGYSMAPKQAWYQSKWVKIGVPVLLVAAIAGGVGGGVAASKSSDSSSSSGSSAKGIQNNAAGAVAPVSTNANSMPIYATGTSTGSAPQATGSPTSGCATDNPTYQTYGNYQVRTDHPRLFASEAQWNCLPSKVGADAYLSSWNSTVMQNATRYAAMEPVQYITDGGLAGSGVLDIARELQLRIKHWAYAWRVTGDSSWVDRTWQEVQVASGNTSQSFGSDTDRWNTQHFLDVAEFTLAFAYAYDWMYDAWTSDQRAAMRSTMVEYGLSKGVEAYNGAGYGWWTNNVKGNWNCVCNGGLSLGALAIIDEDTSGTAQQILNNAIPNAQENCAFAVGTDGTWAETSDYWYFGSTGHAQMASGMLTATGTTQGLITSNPNFNKTGLFHMYGTGFVEKFNYGDCGPNKYTATANCMMFYGDQFDIPMYTLYQRDRSDAPEPLGILWYNSDVSGDWWYNLPLDHHFPNENDAWAAMRSSWTDNNGLYTAMKSGNTTGHQTHGNLDTGDFVLEALGQRWAGELCQENYLNTGYFSSEAQSSDRWTYYRCATEGQNTILLNGMNQIVDQSPPTNYDSTGDEQTALTFSVPSNSAAYFYTDMTAAYGGTNISRGIRVLNERRQVLIQDEINGSDNTAQWRMHTNATITLANNNRQANMVLGGQTMAATILGSAPSATFSTAQPTPTGTTSAIPAGGSNSPNPGVTVLLIDIPAGDTTLEVLFNPQWSGMAASAYATPTSVPLSSWSLTSHN